MNEYQSKKLFGMYEIDDNANEHENRTEDDSIKEIFSKFKDDRPSIQKPKNRSANNATKNNPQSNTRQSNTQHNAISNTPNNYYSNTASVPPYFPASPFSPSQQNQKIFSGSRSFSQLMKDIYRTLVGNYNKTDPYELGSLLCSAELGNLLARKYGKKTSQKILIEGSFVGLDLVIRKILEAKS